MGHTPNRGFWASLKARNVDPLLNARTLDGHILAAETIFKLIAIIVTSIGFFVWGQDLTAQYGGPPWLGYVVGALFAFVAAWVTDISFSHFLETVLYQLITFFSFNWLTTDPKGGIYRHYFLMPLRWGVVMTIVAALFYADYKSVYTLKDPIANAREHYKPTDYHSLHNQQQERVRDATADFDRQIKEEKQERDRKVANAQHHSALQQLANGGNGWAKQQIKSRADAAEAPYKKRIARLQEKRDKAADAERTANEQERNNIIIADNAALSADSGNREAISGMFTQFGLGSKIMTILLRLLLIINFLVNNPGDWNGDGKIDGEDVTAAAGRKNKAENFDHSQNRGAPVFRNSVDHRTSDPSDPGRTVVLGFVNRPDTPAAQSLQTVSQNRMMDAQSATQSPTVSQCDTVENTPAEPHMAPNTTVTQCDTGLESPSGANPAQATTNGRVTATTKKQAAAGFVIADPKAWRNACSTYYKRYFLDTSDRDTRQNNLERSQCNARKLEAAGYSVEFLPGEQSIKVTGPHFQPNADELNRVVRQENEMLDSINRRRRNNDQLRA